MSNNTDISVEAGDYGIILRLIGYLLDEDLDQNTPFRYNVLLALGGLTSTEKPEVIDDMLEQGVIDNLFKACDTDNEQNNEKVLWV